MVEGSMGGQGKSRGVLLRALLVSLHLTCQVTLYKPNTAPHTTHHKNTLQNTRLKHHTPHTIHHPLHHTSHKTRHIPQTTQNTPLKNHTSYNTHHTTHPHTIPHTKYNKQNTPHVLDFISPNGNQLVSSCRPHVLLASQLAASCPASWQPTGNLASWLKPEIYSARRQPDTRPWCLYPQTIKDSTKIQQLALGAIFCLI